MAKPNLGTKRVCPETGRKFYDLNKDPIVSPYTGQSYPLSYFESGHDSAPAEEEEAEPAEVGTEEEDTGEAEVVSLEEADEEQSGSGTEVPDVDADDDDVELDDDSDDTFLEEEEEEEDDDVKDIIGGGVDDDED